MRRRRRCEPSVASGTHRQAPGCPRCQCRSRTRRRRRRRHHALDTVATAPRTPLPGLLRGTTSSRRRTARTFAKGVLRGASPRGGATPSPRYRGGPVGVRQAAARSAPGDWRTPAQGCPDDQGLASSISRATADTVHRHRPAIHVGVVGGANVESREFRRPSPSQLEGCPVISICEHGARIARYLVWHEVPRLGWERRTRHLRIATRAGIVLQVPRRCHRQYAIRRGTEVGVATREVYSSRDVRGEVPPQRGPRPKLVLTAQGGPSQRRRLDVVDVVSDQSGRSPATAPDAEAGR